MNLAILCPGQGSQDPAALAALAGEGAARPIVAAFEEVAGVTLAALARLPEERRQCNRLAQPLVCATALASFAVLRDALPGPVAFAGYSVGELAAYGCAGWLSAEETLRLAVVRATAMDAAYDRAMAMGAVRGLDPARLATLLGGREAYVAIRNGADRFVVAGEAEAVRLVLAQAGAAGAGTTRLGVRVASHTPLMRAAVEPFRRALEGSSLRVGDARILAGIDGTPVLTRERAVDTLSSQLECPVDWAACLTGLEEARIDTALEMPAGSDLSKLVREYGGNVESRGVADFASPEGLSRWIERRAKRQGAR